MGDELGLAGDDPIWFGGERVECLRAFGEQVALGFLDGCQRLGVRLLAEGLALGGEFGGAQVESSAGLALALTELVHPPHQR